MYSLISICDRKIDRTELLVSIIFELQKLYSLLESGRFSKVVKLWEKCSYDYQKKVKIYKNSKSISGVSCGIDIYGNLILKSGQKKETVYPSSSMEILG